MWNLVKEQLSTEKLNNFLLAQDDERRTACQVAAFCSKIEILNKLWKWSKEVLNTDELNNNLLLAKYRYEYTFLHYAQYSDTVQLLERTWNLAKDHLSPEELNKCLLADDSRG
jgi:hypothetical protein